MQGFFAASVKCFYSKFNSDVSDTVAFTVIK